MDEGEPPLGERPAQDELEVSVAEARIAAALFGVKQEVRVGRYQLLDLVGRGGMSVVWGAWDPELERKVAIKLVDPLKATTRDRIVDEARALAKLSHPHVVPIYDVGVIDDRVYLVMEWIAGDNLRVHLEKQRTPREIVALYLQAARGLAAIHAAGLVHRDFKPDNAVVGADGRVRVLDFGLAKLDADAPTTDIAGTPRYMAPEHAAGGRPTAAVDQYAMCVSLREALEHGGREVPRWLAAIVARGTAPKPEDRFASMDALIRALERDPARVWARRALLGGAIVAAGVAFVVGRAAERETCAGSTVAIAPDTRARLATHLDALGGFAAESRAALLARLDDHEGRLRDAVKGACVAHARGELTPALYDRRLTCLARTRTSLVVSAEILESSTASTFPDARVAAGALVDPDACSRVDESLVPFPDAGALDGVRAVENAIERARMLATAARPEAIAAATGARIAAEATGYQPVVARALLVEGRAQMFANDDRASTTLERAMLDAFAAHDDVIAVEAFARRAFVLSTVENRVIDGSSVIRAVADRLGSDGAFARQLLLNNLAAVHILVLNDRTAARALLETALRMWRPARGENDYELVSILQNLAAALDDRARTNDLLARAHEEVVRLFGRDHPRVLEVERFQYLFLDLPEARSVAKSACERYARLFPHLRVIYAHCTYDAGWLADQAGDLPAARAYFAAATWGSAEPLRTMVRTSMVELADGKATASTAAALESAGDNIGPAPSVGDSYAAGDAFTAAARIWEIVGNHAASQRCWAKAVAVMAPTERPYSRRRLERARKAAAG